jgi:subtilisin family serine protease
MPGANTYKTGGMNVHKAWEMGIIGKGVNVVNVDNGIQHTHDDLYLNYDPSLSTDLIDNDEYEYLTNCF